MTTDLAESSQIPQAQTQVGIFLLIRTTTSEIKSERRSQPRQGLHRSIPTPSGNVIFSRRHAPGLYIYTTLPYKANAETHLKLIISPRRVFLIQLNHPSSTFVVDETCFDIMDRNYGKRVNSRVVYWRFLWDNETNVLDSALCIVFNWCKTSPTISILECRRERKKLNRKTTCFRQ